MFITLVAVIAALVLGHVAPALGASLRQFHWYSQWLEWLGAHSAEGAFWRGRYGIWLALLPPVLLVLLLQALLSGRLLGLVSLLYGVVVLVWVWGPRDLDIDVESVLDATEPDTRRARLAHQGQPRHVGLAQIGIRQCCQGCAQFGALAPVGGAIENPASFLEAVQKTGLAQ